MDKWFSTGKYGIRYREHKNKTVGVGRSKRPRRYYSAVYKWQGRTVTDAYGWEGADFHNEDDIVETALMLRQNRKAMTPPFTLRELIEERKQILEAQKEKALRQKNRWTIQKLWEAYTTQLPKGANRTDSSFYRNYLEKSFGPKEPGQLVKLDTDRLRINLLKKKSPQTVKHVLALLTRIINYGVNHGHVSPLPFKIVFPSVDNTKTEDLTPEQLHRLLSVLDTTQYQTAANMMKLALFTGMRRGEIFKLRWDDLAFHRGFIFIQEPKGGKSQKIPMNSKSRELLQGIPATDSEYVFPARNGGPRKDINKDVNNIKAEAGLPPDFRPMHGLRHVYATMLANSGTVDMFTLQKLLTHKSPEMTQRYAHFRDEAMKRAASQVDDIISDTLDKKDKKEQAS